MKKAIIAAGIVVLVLILVAVAIPFLVDADKFRPRVEQEASAALGRNVTIGHLSLSILRQSVIAEDVQIADDLKFAKQPFLTAKSLHIGAQIWPLIARKELQIDSVGLDEPKIRLTKSAAGKWNFESLGANQQTRTSSGPTPPMSVSQLKVNDGEITLEQAGKKNTYTHVNAKLSNFSDTSEFPFSLSAEAPGGGTLQAEGEAGPLAKGDMTATPMHADLLVKQLDLAKTGFVDPATGMAGNVDYLGKVNSDGKVLQSEGKVIATGLKLVKAGAPAKQPINVEYATDFDLAKKQGVIKRADIVAGASKAKITGTYETKGDALVLHTGLKADAMPVDSVAGLLPAFGVILPQGVGVQGGTVSTDMQIQGPVNALVITGPISVANTKVDNFNLKQRASAIGALAGLQSGSDLLIQALNSKLRVAPEGIRADAINLVVPNLGTVTGGGVIGANNSLNFKMQAKLVGGGGLLGVGSALSTLGQSKGELPFLIQGTTSNPVFLPDVAGAMANTAMAPVKSVEGVSGMLGGLFGKKKK